MGSPMVMRAKRVTWICESYSSRAMTWRRRASSVDEMVNREGRLVEFLWGVAEKDDVAATFYIKNGNTLR